MLSLTDWVIFSEDIKELPTIKNIKLNMKSTLKTVSFLPHTAKTIHNLNYKINFEIKITLLFYEKTDH